MKPVIFICIFFFIFILCVFHMKLFIIHYKALLVAYSALKQSFFLEPILESSRFYLSMSKSLFFFVQ